jgi:hypothetical protein
MAQRVATYYYLAPVQALARQIGLPAGPLEAAAKAGEVIALERNGTFLVAPLDAHVWGETKGYYR